MFMRFTNEEYKACERLQTNGFKKKVLDESWNSKFMSRIRRLLCIIFFAGSKKIIGKMPKTNTT